MLDFIDRRLNFTSFLVIAITLGSFFFLALICFVNIPDKAQSVVFTLVGGLFGSLGTIVTFKFGSSAGGQKTREDLIAKIGDPNGH